MTDDAEQFAAVPARDAPSAAIWYTLEAAAGNGIEGPFMIQTFDFDPGELRRLIAPNHVRSSINQVISMAWMFAPPEQKSVAGIRRVATEIIAEAIAWWRPLDKSDLEKQTDSAGGLKIDDFKSMDPARLAARNMMMTCWIALPEERRSDDEVERIVGLLLERSLAALEEDAALFEHPLR